MTSIEVNTENKLYGPGEQIKIFGKVKEILSAGAITLTVISPNGSLVSIAQMKVESDKTFSTSIIAGGGIDES